MLTTYHMVRKNPDINSAIGHHTVEVHIEERDGTEVVGRGVMEKYGISTAELLRRYDGDVEKWLSRVAREMLDKYKQRAGVQTDLLKVHGTDILIPE